MLATTTPTNAVAEVPKPPRLHLSYLDGLRGLAALFVAMTHAYFGLCADVVLPHKLAVATYWLYLGRCGVDIFIVLSGYCLMIPVARSEAKRLPGGTWQFLMRRARRILPPYYGALAVCMLGVFLVPDLQKDSAITLWRQVFPVFTPAVILSHLMLVHNFSPAWSHKIDYPMWSVATEWQIYFLLPLLLLPVWRRFGLVATVVAGFAVGLSLLIIFPSEMKEASSHYLGLFALGMAGAGLGLSNVPAYTRIEQRLPWGSFASFLFLILCIPVSLYMRFFRPSVMEKDIILGVATTCLLIYCTRHTRQSSPRPPVVLRVLQSRWPVSLGAFSYSLYLIHAPVLALVWAQFLRLHLSPTVSLVALMGIGLPLALVIAYLFHLVFEKPFLKVTANKKSMIHLVAAPQEQAVS